MHPEPTPSDPHVTDDKPQPKAPAEKPAPSVFRDFLSVMGVLVSALILAYGLITFVFQSYQVDGPSMEKTLENRDHLIVWKASKTVADFRGKAYIPARGDIIVFNAILDGMDDQLIKRVIALPGERVKVKDNEVTVYNTANPDGFNPDKTMPYGSVISITPGNGEWTVGEDEVFVLGDHRDNSRDSRDIGPIGSDQIIGKLLVRVLPLNSFTRF